MSRGPARVLILMGIALSIPLCLPSSGTAQSLQSSMIARELDLPAVADGGGNLTIAAFANADFDEDGVQDLVVAFTGDGQSSRVVVFPGNIDAIYPNSPAARARRSEGTFSNAPFAANPTSAEVELAPDVLVTGDLDNDGHWDVAVAGRGESYLEWLRGNGSGQLTAAGRVGLPRPVTAMIAGDVNRPDAVDDLVVAVASGRGAQLMIFESPLGALGGVPEVFDLPAPATDLAIGRLGSWLPSVVAAAGQDLVVVHGRDRRLSLDAARREAVTPARVDILRLAAPAVALTTRVTVDAMADDVVALLDDGRVAVVGGVAVARLVAGEISDAEAIQTFDADRRVVGARSRLAAARSTGGAGLDLVVVDPDAGEVSLLVLQDGEARAERVRLTSGELAPAVLALRLSPAALKSFLVPRRDRPDRLVELVTPTRSVFVVNDNDDEPDFAADGVCETAPGNGVCTLRAAINEVNAVPGPHEISFAGLAAGDNTIFPRSELPSITRVITIDGTSHPDGMVELDGTAAGVASGLEVAGGASTVRGLAVFSFDVYGIVLSLHDESHVEGCHVGLDASGSVGHGQSSGVLTASSKLHHIGGPAGPARNVISGNGGGGVALWHGSFVEGNLIGTDPSGSTPVPNGCGVQAQSNLNTVGGWTAGTGNVISGNRGSGVLLGYHGFILGNLIGTDLSGTTALGNGDEGVYLGSGVTEVTVGTNGALTGNVISANGEHGLEMVGVTSLGSGNLIMNNKIGTDVTGTAALGNVSGGVKISGGYDHVVGGTVPLSRNLISGNGGPGVEITGCNFNAVLGNTIGADATGELPLPNSGAGVALSSTNSTMIGGAAEGEGNLIAFNPGDGIRVTGSGLFNSFLRNTMAANGELPVDLGDDGHTSNDTGDADSGVNGLMNFPVVTAARINLAGEVEVTYGVDSDPANADYDLRVELYATDSADVDAALRFLGADAFTTADHGAGFATVVLGTATTLGVVAGDFINAVATDENGNTSEVGPAALVGNDADIFADGFELGTAEAWDGAVS